MIAHEAEWFESRCSASPYRCGSIRIESADFCARLCTRACEHRRAQAQRQHGKARSVLCSRHRCSRRLDPVAGPDEFFEITFHRIGAWKSWTAQAACSPCHARRSEAQMEIEYRFRGRPTVPRALRSCENEAGVVKPERQCEVSNDKSGSILSFYSGVRTITGAIRSIVLGDAVTPQGKRYGIDLGSASPARIDTLVALAGRAILTGRQH